ncbi:hypothetical protein Q0M10_14290, partial [Staphylococcus aureus]|nr:hypothetical protein [Staphylococcus aureus]
LLSCLFVFVTVVPYFDFYMCDRYLRTIMTFLGVPSYDTIIIEGHNAEPHQTEEIKATIINYAEKLATTF